MTDADFSASISARIPAATASDLIGRIGQWWTRGVSGESHRQHERFTVRFGETRVDVAISESVPGRRHVWQVVASHLPWIATPSKWTGTRITWDLDEVAGLTSVRMTHVGLHPGLACAETCAHGWTLHVGHRLQRLLRHDRGCPDVRPATALEQLMAQLRAANRHAPVTDREIDAMPPAEVRRVLAQYDRA